MYNGRAPGLTDRTWATSCTRELNFGLTREEEARKAGGTISVPLVDEAVRDMVTMAAEGSGLDGAPRIVNRHGRTDLLP